MARTPGPYEIPGQPLMLARLPSPALLREAKATKTADAVERALRLRDSAASARNALTQARMAVKAAEGKGPRRARFLGREGRACAP